MTMATTIANKDESTHHSIDSPADLAEAISPLAATQGFWRSPAPKGVARGADDHWNEWVRHLRTRRTPKSLEKLCGSKLSPLGWGIVQENLSPSAVSLLEVCDKLARNSRGDSSAANKLASKSLEKALADWLAGTCDPSQSADYALACLAVANALPPLSDQVSAELWWQLVDALWQVVQAALDWCADSERPADEALAQQLLVGELPLTLSYLFPEIKPLHKLRSAARESLSNGMEELLNGEGLLQGGHLPVMRPLLACWTRCRAMGQQLKKGCWNQKAESQYLWLAGQAIRWSTADGRSLLASVPPQETKCGLTWSLATWSPDFLQAVIDLGGDASDQAAACALLDKKTVALLGKPKNIEPPETSDHCQWAGIAVMRTNWDRKSPVLAVDYSAPELRIEIHKGQQRLVAGTWASSTTLDGKLLELAGEWDEACWFSDDDVDYLELSIEMAGGARLERQILLAREDLFLLLVDNVLDTRGGRLEHTSRLPLDAAIAFQPEMETREGLLTAKKTVARVLPIALPEWRADRRVGELTCEEDHLQQHLQWTQQTTGRNLACPLFIDLNARRATKQCTWRQLTVAQSLEIQPAEIAVGYRVQCAKEQWLIYRSLVPSANRTLLGYNLSSECLVARFLAPSGEVDELLEIEG